MLRKMLAQRVRDLQPADECECGDVITAVGNLGQLALKVANVKFEVVALPHFNSEKMVVIPLSLSARCVLSEQHFGNLLKVVERI